LENCELVTKREDLHLQGGSGSKTGGYQSEKGDEKSASSRYHQDLTNDRNLCIFRSDGVFGNYKFFLCTDKALLPHDCRSYEELLSASIRQSNRTDGDD
jgi:hypothetical protein